LARVECALEGVSSNSAVENLFASENTQDSSSVNPNESVGTMVGLQLWLRLAEG